MMTKSFADVITLPTPDAEVGQYLRTTPVNQLVRDILTLLKKHPSLIEISGQYSHKQHRQLMAHLVDIPQSTAHPFVMRTAIEGAFMIGILAGYKLKEKEGKNV